MKRVIKNAHELKRETFCMLRVPAKLTDLMEDKLKPEPSILKPTKCACFGFSELGGQKELDEMNAVWKYKIMAHVPSLLCEGQGRKNKKIKNCALPAQQRTFKKVAKPLQYSEKAKWMGSSLNICVHATRSPAQMLHTLGPRYSVLFWDYV